jgi:hypothetical protein
MRLLKEANRFSTRLALPTKARRKPTTVTVARTESTTSASNAWSSTSIGRTYLTRPASTTRIACIGNLSVSRASVATAGPLKSIIKKARRRGWTSIRCGTSGPYRGILASSPSPTAYCAPPHTTKHSCTSFNANSRRLSKAAHRSGVGPPKLRACGL